MAKARLFGTDGVRGIANTELTPELAFKLGEAAGRYLGSRIVVGKDTRKSGDMLESALVAGLNSAGATALLAGVIPTPAIALLTRELGCDGGVVISASHNPPQYNGIKLFSRDGFKLPDEIEDEIEEMLVTSDDVDSRGTGADIGVIEHVEDAMERYIAHAVSTVDVSLAGLKVAIDCGHGASYYSTPEAFRRLGAEVFVINDTYNGMDINVGSGSTHLEPAIDLVLSAGADLGISHDGDADRVLAIDEKGESVDGDFIEAICAVDLASRGELPGDTVVSTVMANLGLQVALKEHGISLVKTNVGDRYVLEAMRMGGLALGGEQSGHVIFLKHNTTGDGLITALQLASVMVRQGKPLSQIRTVMTRFPQVMENVHVANKGRLAASAAIATAIAAGEAKLGETGRVLVRPSGTESLVRVMAEAADEAMAAEVVAQISAVVRAELA